jgi:putative transposase
MHSAHADPIAPNRLARQFDTHGRSLKQVWVSDSTHISTCEGFLFLSTILNLASRRFNGWRD